MPYSHSKMTRRSTPSSGGTAQWCRMFNWFVTVLASLFGIETKIVGTASRGLDTHIEREYHRRCYIERLSRGRCKISKKTLTRIERSEMFMKCCDCNRDD